MILAIFKYVVELIIFMLFCYRSLSRNFSSGKIGTDFCKQCKVTVQFSFHVDIQFSQHYLLKTQFFLHCVIFTSLSKII